MERNKSKYKFVISENEKSYKPYFEDEATYGAGNAIIVVSTDTENKPVVGQKIYCYDNNNNFLHVITTNKDGLAGIKNLTDGTYYLIVEGNEKNKHYVRLDNNKILRVDIQDGVFK